MDGAGNTPLRADLTFLGEYTEFIPSLLQGSLLCISFPSGSRDPPPLKDIHSLVHKMPTKGTLHRTESVSGGVGCEHWGRQEEGWRRAPKGLPQQHGLMRYSSHIQLLGVKRDNSAPQISSYISNAPSHTCSINYRTRLPPQSPLHDRDGPERSGKGCPRGTFAEM